MMTKVSKTPDRRDIRIFRTESGSDLAELDDAGFANEEQLHRLIEGNIGKLFHGLTFLKRKFRELDGGRHIPDTVAFDAGQNTFVVIEYKNKLDKGVIDQTKAYLKYMKNNKQALVLEYVKSEGEGALYLKSYNWDVYAIIMAPEFSKNQIDSTEEAKDLELHEIRQYADNVVTVKRVSGAHEGAPRDEGPAPEPRGFHQDLSDATRKLFGYVDGKLKDRFALECDIKRHQANYGFGSKRDILWIYARKTQLTLLLHIYKDEDLPPEAYAVLLLPNMSRNNPRFYYKIKTERNFEEIVPLIEHVVRREQGLQ